jgi:DNA-binding transcriptional regulator YhcF (GntR family)
MPMKMDMSCDDQASTEMEDLQTARLAQLEALSESARSLNFDYLGVVSPDAREAASRQIADQIRMAIATGGLRAGEMLPSLARLASHYGVARETTKAALAQLRSEGLVWRWQGKETSVRDVSTLGGQHLRVELAEIQEKVHRLKRGLVAIEGVLADLISSLLGDGRQEASGRVDEGRRR